MDQVEGPPSKAVAKTQLKKNERTLRSTISGAIANTRRLVSQPMTQTQLHKAAPLVKKLQTQIREEYCDIVFKLKVAILSEEQASEEDTILLKMVENMPQPEKVMGPGTAGSPVVTQEG